MRMMGTVAVVWMVAVGLVGCGATDLETMTTAAGACDDAGMTQDDGDAMNLTASFLTNMVAGQSNLGNSLSIDSLDAGEYTLQFAFVGVGQVLGVPGAQPVANAIVTWMVAGQQQRRVISIVSGAAISGVAEGVNVQIQDLNGNPALTTFSAGTPYSVQTTLSKGGRGTSKQPPLLLNTTVTNVVAHGGTLTINVPPDSGVISVFVFATSADTTALATTDIIVKQVDGSGALIGATFYPQMVNDWVPLNPACAQLLITNNNGAHSAFVNVVWGIEG